MKQSTTFAQVATNLLNVLQGYTKGIRFLLVIFLTLTVSTNAWAEEATLSFASTTQRVSQTTTKQVWSNGGITFTNNKASSTTSVANYSNPVRLYANSEVIVEHTSGKMTKIVFDCNNTTCANDMKTSIGTVNGATVTVSSDKVTATFTSAVASFTVAKLSAQVRLDAITVTYEAGYNITYTGDEHITYSGTKPETIKKEDSGFELEFSVDDGYKLNNVQVKMGGQNLVVDDDYLWEEGYLLILPETDITGDIEIIFETVATCTAPTITTQPSAATYTKGATATALKVVASGDDLTYQWYSNTSNSTSGATKINGATNSTYTPSTSTVGTKYYYCIVSSGSCSTTSNIVSVVVKNPPFTVTLVPGSGSVTSTTLTESSAGAGVELPEPTLDCGEWSFAGWKTSSAVTEETTTKPTLIPAGAYNPASNITLYAVYQRTEETEGTPTTITTTDKLTRSTTGINNDAGYGTWSEKTANSSAVYAGQSAGGYDAIQLRTTNSNSGIITTASGGKAKKVTVEWQSNTASNRTLDIYGKNSAYSAATDLYNTNTRGTKLGSIVNGTSTELTITDDYEYIGLRSNSGAMYLTSISIEWATTTNGGTSTTTYYHSTPDCGAPCTDAVTINKGTETNGTFTLSTTGPQSTCDGSVTVTLSNIQPATGYQFSEITQTGINTGVAINNTEKTVTYAKNTTGTSTINVTFIEIPKHTVTLNPNYPNGETGTFKDKDGNTVSGNLVLTYDYNTASMSLTDLYQSIELEGYQFNGWYSATSGGSKWTSTGIITKDVTVYAQWSKLYTITLSENSTTNELAPQTSTSYTLPTELSAGTCQDDTKELVGWSTVAIPNPGDKPTSNFYELGATVTLTADQTTFYAVFATADNGGVDNTDYSNVHTSNVTLDKTGGTNATDSKVKIGGIDYTAVKAGTGSAKGAVKITVPAGTTKLSFHMAGWNGEGNKTISLSGATADPSSFKTVADAGVSGNSTTYTLSGTIADYFYSTTLSNINTETTLTFSNGGADQRFVIWGVNASTGGATSYSDYTTTCVKLPDPVLSFATEPANPIVFTDAVCGGNSSKQSVTVVGENLRDVVNVSVTGPYKIARTASTALKDFTTSLTLDKTAAGAIHSNYQTVYIISTPPAQSTEATTGTLTFTTTKGNTLIVNLSTPTVTCTQYTLTLVDRGVSTLQPETYFAGQTIDEAPADPEGVCTDPIHYVFDGWAEATVAAGATTYTKVTFPYTVEGNTKFYAVYRYLEGGGNGDYNLVTSALDDWSGDYLIAYSNTIFADGQIGGKDAFAIGAAGSNVDLSQHISNNTIPATEGDKYNVTLEAVTGGYVLKTKDGNYNYYTTNESNGISVSTKNTAANYPITVKFVSEEEINLCLGGSAIGSVFRYNAQGFFRFYKNGGQNPVYLYKKADGTTYYTTSPVCGPHLAITEGKEIYVTGGNAGGTRDLVIAQQKVSYKATRLQTSNGLADGTAPDVKVATNGITVGGVVTQDVKVTIDQTKEQQTDGTYTITGTITVQYQPSANNKQEDIQVQLAVDYNAEARDNFTVHARSLPSEFVIVAKSGDKWYALNGDMNNGSSANPANGQVTLDNDANPTKATYAPCNTIYTFDGVPNTGDRTRVRFQGTDGAWLWAASGTNVGIQNKSLKDTPEGDNKAYNWKLETEDNITYKFHNDNSSRQLTLNGEKFGMYASGVQDIRILPYDEKCLYNYAPSNLIVKELKGSYVVLTWDAVVGATKYQYSTNATTWTDAGTEPTVTISGLSNGTDYTYYVRAYHADAGVSQECFDYSEVSFTTADCDDVPTDITYTADLNSITVSWTAAASTATITYNTKEDGTGGGGTINDATSPYKISGGLDKNTTYYIQILADGTCASPIIPVKTEDVEVDIVEWDPQGIIVDINTDETIGVTLENEVSYGSGLGTEATELFFSKYYEASYNVKLVAIYNGTKNIIDLTDYIIKYGKTSWESNYITLKDFGTTKGQIQPGEEIILYSMQDGTQDDEIMDCVHEDFPDGNWVEVTSSNNDGKGTLSFGGDKTIILCKTEYDDEADEYYDNIIDVIGALKEDPNEGILPTNENTEKPFWGDKEGWVCETGLSLADDSQIGISTNRCLLVRNNTVTSGLNAVAQNIEGDFVTLCSEWKGAQVPDSDIDNGVAASCENFAYVGTFDYSDYYTKYVPMGDEQIFDENKRNEDGTVTIRITDLYKHACSNIRVKLSNSNGEVLTDREYKVPIMITTTQGTDGQTFLDLQQNLATKEVDGEGNVINTYPLSLDEVREICKTCDVVVRDNATLTKVTDGTENDHPQVHDVIVYEGASIVIPDGNNHNYTINSLSLRRKGDEVASAQVQGTGKFVLPADAPVTLSMRIDANNWHWFTLPYDCDIADVTWSDGTPAQYNKDWFLMYYDGESRAASTNPYDNHWKVYSGTTIEAGKGYIIGITGNLAHPNYTFELRFPMEQDVLTAEQTNKTVALNTWGVKSDNTPNNLGWNLVGNPYLNYYQPQTAGFEGLSLLKYTGMDPVTGDRLYDNSGHIPFLVTPIDGGWYEYQQELASDVQMMPFTAYFVQVGDPDKHENGQALDASFEASNRGKKSILHRAPNEVEENSDPAIVAISLTNAKGESDKTTLLIADRFTNEYEMNADFFKWFGDYYKYYTKPVLYTLGADQGKRAFNALSEQLAAQPVALGLYAAQAGNYTFSLNQRAELYAVAEVWLHDANNNTYTNLMQEDYTTSIAKTDGAGRFSLSVKMMQKLPTDIENTKQGNIWATTQNNHIIVNGLAKDMQLWIYDATGKLLHADRTTNYQHSYSASQTGTYFIRVQNTTNTQTIKVVVE